MYVYRHVCKYVCLFVCLRACISVFLGHLPVCLVVFQYSITINYAVHVVTTSIEAHFVIQGCQTSINSSISYFEHPQIVPAHDNAYVMV